MKKKFLTKKRATGLLAGVAAAALLLTGTFAWSDYTQHKTNAFTSGTTVEVTLNDAFTPPSNWEPGSTVSKKVSVTSTANSQTKAYVRLQLKEYLEFTNMEVIKDNTGKEVLFATYAEGAKQGEYMTWADAQANGFNYTSFTVNGVDYACTQNAELRNGIYGKHMYVKSGQTTVFGTAAKAPYPNQEHAQQNPDNPGPECLYNIHNWGSCNIIDNDTGATHTHTYTTITPGADVMTMSEWVSQGQPLGNFWILDDSNANGWAYWANSLLPGSTTSNLIESVTLKNDVIKDNLEYYIHIDMQSVSFDELSKFETGASPAAIALITKLRQPGGGWQMNGNGTASQLVMVNGSLQLGATVIVGPDGIPGTDDDNCLVNPAGTIIKTGATVQFDANGNVPYVDLGNGFKLYPGPDAIIGTPDDIIPDFGHYHQEVAMTDRLNWRLLDINGNQATIVCNTVLDRVTYNGSVLNILSNLTWQSSGYRTWLNGAFFTNSFSPAEKAKIVPTQVGMPAETFNLLSAVTGGTLSLVTTATQTVTGTDNVWALSVTEANKYFGVGATGYSKAIIKGNTYAGSKGTTISGGNARWLTRSCGLTPINSVGIASNGAILGTLSNLGDGCGALPALTVTIG